MDINKYKPINTKEKVDSILNELIKNVLIQSTVEVLESEILLGIKKVKLQFYFKSEFDKIRVNLRSQRRDKPVCKGQDVALEKCNVLARRQRTYHINLKFIEGLTIKLISKIVDTNPEIIITALEKRGQKNMSPQSILDRKTCNSINNLLQDCYNNKFSSALYKKESKSKISSNPYLGKHSFVKNNNFYPSHGKSGNYFKLIYIRARS